METGVLCKGGYPTFLWISRLEILFIVDNKLG
jgi:hypothetical protein